MVESCHVTTDQAGGGGVMVWWMFYWYTLGPLVPIGHRLNATAYLSIVSDHVHPLMGHYSSRIMQHVTKLESFQIGFLNI